MGDVRVEVEGPITTIWMDRPDRRNAVDRVMAGELRAAFEEFEADQDQRGRSWPAAAAPSARAPT